jgi:hypothetical protein
MTSAPDPPERAWETLLTVDGGRERLAQAEQRLKLYAEAGRPHEDEIEELATALAEAGCLTATEGKDGWRPAAAKALEGLLAAGVGRWNFYRPLRVELLRRAPSPPEADRLADWAADVLETLGRGGLDAAALSALNAEAGLIREAAEEEASWQDSWRADNLVAPGARNFRAALASAFAGAIGTAVAAAAVGRAAGRRPAACRRN